MTDNKTAIFNFIINVAILFLCTFHRHIRVHTGSIDTFRLFYIMHISYIGISFKLVIIYTLMRCCFSLTGFSFIFLRCNRLLGHGRFIRCRCLNIYFISLCFRNIINRFGVVINIVLNPTHFFQIHTIIQDHCLKLCERLINQVTHHWVWRKRNLTMTFYDNTLTSVYVDALTFTHVNHLECAKPFYLYGLLGV